MEKQDEFTYNGGARFKDGLMSMKVKLGAFDKEELVLRILTGNGRLVALLAVFVVLPMAACDTSQPDCERECSSQDVEDTAGDTIPDNKMGDVQVEPGAPAIGGYPDTSGASDAAPDEGEPEADADAGAELDPGVSACPDPGPTSCPDPGSGSCPDVRHLTEDTGEADAGGEVGAACEEAGDCASGICSDGACVAFDCDDGIRNGEEIALDCGGPDCLACLLEACEEPAVCQSGICSRGVCVPFDCYDGLLNGSEMQVDCGGPFCLACLDSECVDDSDCESGVCSDGLCVPFDCLDGIQNGGETGVDCGGPDCKICLGEPCSDASQCVSGICSGSLCVEFDCTDSIKNGSETGIDCGGPSCPACDLPCDEAAECASGICSDGLCAPFDCDDGLLNGLETGVDCGGAHCPPCDGCRLAHLIPAAALPFEAQGDTSGLANDSSGPAFACHGFQTTRGELSPDEAWSFTPDETGPYVVTLDPTFNAALYVASGCPDIADTCLAGLPATFASEPVRVLLQLDGGIEYSIVVDGADGLPETAGTYTLGVAACVPDCEGKQCGSDGCGGSCAPCAADEFCDLDATCRPIPTDDRCGDMVCLGESAVHDIVGPVTFTSRFGVCENTGTLVKQIDEGTDAGTVSGAGFDPALDMTRGVLFKAVRNDAELAVGLSQDSRNSSLEDIDFALLLGADAGISVYEKGVFAGSFGSYEAGDQLGVAQGHESVTYLRNGQAFYTSLAEGVAPLYVDTSFHTECAAVEGVTWTEAPEDAPAALAPDQPVYWADVKGLLAKAGQVTSMDWAPSTFVPAPEGYARSLRSFSARSDVAGVRWRVQSAGADQTGGLSSVSHGRGADIDYAIHMDGAGYFHVLERGEVAFDSQLEYAAGDLFSVQLSSEGKIEYHHNGAIFHTSASEHIPDAELAVVVSSTVKPEEEPRSLTEVHWVGSYEHQREGLVTFTHVRGMAQGEGSLSKSGPDGWNAGAFSGVGFSTKDATRGISFTAGRNDKSLVIGLSGDDDGVSWQTIDYGVHLRDDGRIGVFEASVNRGVFSNYRPGDQLSIYVDEGQIHYAHNGSVFFASPKKPRFPLSVDCSFHDDGGSLFDIQWIRAPIRLPVRLIPGQSVYWKGHLAIATRPGMLETIPYESPPGHAFAGGNVRSVRQFSRGEEVAGFSWKVEAADLDLSIGLTHSTESVDYGVALGGDGSISVVEGGVTVMELKSHYRGGDVFKVEVSQYNHIIYTHNDVQFYTSDVELRYPLFVVVESSLDTPAGNRCVDLSWLAPQTREHRPDGLVTFRNIIGLREGDGSLTHIAADGYEGGASSGAEVQPGRTQHVGVSFKPYQRGAELLLGLSNGDDDASLHDVDFGMQMRADGRLAVYEGGVHRGTFGHYGAHDELAVVVQFERARYLHNGKTFYTSTVAPRYPLHVDSSFGTPEARAYDIRWVPEPLVVPRTLVPGQSVYWREVFAFSASSGAVKTVAFTPPEGIPYLGGVARSARTLNTSSEKVGGVQWRVMDIELGLVAGFHERENDRVAFGIDLGADGKVSAVESGLPVFELPGTYAVGDTFAVKLNGRRFDYIHNGTAFYSSTVDPDFPLEAIVRSEPSSPVGVQCKDFKWVGP